MMKPSPDMVALQSKNQELRKKYKDERVKSAMLSLTLRFQKQKTQSEADITRLKIQLEEELTSMQKGNDVFFAQILEEVTHMVGGRSFDGLATQFQTTSIGDTGSSSEFYGAMALARLAEVEGDQGKFSAPCVNTTEPLAPDPQLINHPELIQQQLHSVMPQLHLLDRHIAFVDEGLPGNAPPGLSLPNEQSTAKTALEKDAPTLSEAGQHAFTQEAAASTVLEDFWDTDDKLLLQMEEREGAESGADQHNVETFGEMASFTDNQSQCSERTDYTVLVYDDVRKVQTQLKVQKMLSMHFEMPFGTFSDGVAYLKECAGTPEYDNFEKKVISRFGDVDMLTLLDTINSQANVAKHPRKLTTSDPSLSDEYADSSAGEQPHAPIQDIDVAEALSTYVSAIEGYIMPACRISGFYKQDPRYRDIITKDGRKCREFCEAHPSLLEFQPDSPGPGSIKVPLGWPREESVFDVLRRSPDIAKRLCVIVSDLNENEQAMSDEQFQLHIEQQTGDKLPACPQKMKHVAKVGCSDMDSVSRVMQCFEGRVERYEVRWPKKLKMNDVLHPRNSCDAAYAERLVLFFHQIDGKQLADIADEISETAGVTLAVDPHIPSSNGTIAFVGCRSESDRMLVLSTFARQAKPYRKKC